MTVKELEKNLKSLPVAGHFRYPGYIDDVRLRKLTDPRRKNGLSNKLYRSFIQEDGIVYIWRII